MKPRTIEEIEKAFREMGISEKAWGTLSITQPEELGQVQLGPQLFIRIEATTTPLEDKSGADLA
jgi:hypothetical protein